MGFLSEKHLADLKKSGLTKETILASGIYSAPETEVRGILGYGAGAGMIIPYKPWRDGLDDFRRVKLDNPGPDRKKAYRTPKGSGNRIYVPPGMGPDIFSDTSEVIRITEGEKKALKSTQDGFPTIALPGVWNWKTKIHQKSFSIADLDAIAWTDRVTVIVYDSDAELKPSVAWAEYALVQELRGRGANVFILRLPEGPRGEKYGLDDYLVAHGAEAFKNIPMFSLAEADKEEQTFWRIGDLADAYLIRAAQSHLRLRLGGTFDSVMRGVAPGEVLTVLGRSGVGKSAMALNLIESMTLLEETPTLIFSLEMQGVELFERIASMTTEKSGSVLENLARNAGDDDIVVNEMFMKVVQKWNHVIVVEKSCTLERLDELITQARAEDLWRAPLRLVVIDYMGLVGMGRRTTNPYEHMSVVAREIKNLAKRHRVSVIVLCQISREGGDGGVEVKASSSRDSGSIEEAADHIIGIWRPELNTELSEAEREALRGIFKAKVLKQRNGPAGATIRLEWRPDIMRLTGGQLVELG